MAPRVAIVGAGANGGAVAADLTRAGVDVTLIEQWPANVDAMRERGLRVRLRGRECVTPVRAVNLCEVAEIREPFHIVLVMVKAYDTRWATELIRPLLAREGIAVGVQNGMTLDDIADIVGGERTVGAVIELGGAMWEPGVVERDTPHDRAWFAVGAFDGRARDREDEVVALLRHVGTVERVADIRHAKWMKLIVNAAEVAPTAIPDLAMDDGIRDPVLREFILEVGMEAIAVAQALGYQMIPIFGLPDREIEDPASYLAELLDLVVEVMSQPGSRTAMLQDWDKGRRSEVEEMNGIIVREGRRLGVPTPRNERVLELSRSIERGDLEKGPMALARLLARDS